MARYIGTADQGLLAAMRCRTGEWFEDDVEKLIRERLADRHDWRRLHTYHAFVGLVVEDPGLIAVGSHEEDLVTDGGEIVELPGHQHARAAARRPRRLQLPRMPGVRRVEIPRSAP